MPANVFSPMIAGEVGHARRVFHSASNYFRSIDRRSFSLGNAASSASTFAGTAGGVAGGITLGLSATAAGAVAGAGFLAAVAGPQVAVTAAVVGLALLAKGAYSNREAAHKALSKYVWNLVDDVPPALSLSADGLVDAADAALTLMADGKNQMKLLGSKLQSAQEKFARLNSRIERYVRDYVRDKNYLATQGSRSLPAVEARMDKIRTDLREVWDTGSEPGGAIFEYVRRCSHTGNYLQAPHLIALAMKEKYSPGSVVGVAQPDYFAGTTLATNSRGAFTRLDTEYKKVF